MRTIKNHRAVKFYDSGWNQDSDYKHYCELKDGWVFQYGRMAGATSLFFHKLEDFRQANPIPKKEYEEYEKGR